MGFIYVILFTCLATGYLYGQLTKELVKCFYDAAHSLLHFNKSVGNTFVSFLVDAGTTGLSAEFGATVAELKGYVNACDK